MLCTRRMPGAAARPNSYNAEARTVEAVLTTGAPVDRGGWTETLEISPAAVDLSRFDAGQIAVLANHDQSRPIGRLIDVRFEGDSLVGTLKFNETPAGDEFAGMVARGEWRGISIGFRVTKWREGRAKGGQETAIAERWQLLEVSLVAVPADAQAQIRSFPLTPERSPMIEEMPTTIDPAQQAPLPHDAAPNPAETRRAAAISDIGRRAGLDAQIVLEAVTSGEGVEAFRARALDMLAARTPAISGARSFVVHDEGDTMRRGIVAAIGHQLTPPTLRAAPEAHARPWLEGETVADFARAFLGASSRERDIDVIERAFYTTSDFPGLFAGGVERALAAAWQAAPPAFMSLAARRDYVNFRTRSEYSIGSHPEPTLIVEGSEIKYGTVGESEEKTALLSYASGISFSRQLIVNDALGAIAAVLESRNAVALAAIDKIAFNTTLLAASGLGPTLSDGLETFHASHGNLAAAGTAISTVSIGAGRAAMRSQKSLSGLPLVNGPKYLVVGPAKETEAEQVLASIAATRAADTNIFSGKTELIVSNHIGGNQWFLVADPARTPAMVWGTLQGDNLFRVRMDEPFGRQGVSFSLEFDLGVGVIDYRSIYRNPGA